jgi:hypothetical protein
MSRSEGELPAYRYVSPEMTGAEDLWLSGTIPDPDDENGVIAAHWRDLVNTGVQCVATGKEYPPAPASSDAPPPDATAPEPAPLPVVSERLRADLGRYSRPTQARRPCVMCGVLVEVHGEAGVL